MKWIKNNWGWLLVVVLALIPLIIIFNEVFSFNLFGDGSWISMKSITITDRRTGAPRIISGAHIGVKITGEWAIRWLVAVLSLTPVAILTGKKAGLYVRQAAGIAAFIYAILHFVLFCVDRGLMDTFKETGFVLGLISTIIMLVLTITSNRRSMKLLRKFWKKMHKFAYLAAILAVLHVALLNHGDWIPYLAILIIGFAVRMPVIKNLRNKEKTPVPLYVKH